jgi:hypothetical protein
MRVAHYSDFLTGISALIGIPVSGLTDAEVTMLNSYFNRGIRKIWESNNWLDVCPYGEARFPTNLVTYSNDFTASVWTQTNVSVTKAALQNPLDVRINCQKVAETTATGTHGISQAATFIPSFNHQFAFYVRPAGRTYAYISVNDGGSTWTGFFNLTTGAVGTASTGATLAIGRLANGFFLCSISFTSSATAGTGSVSIQTSTDGSTTSFAGTTGSGLYIWGVTGAQNSYPAPGNFYIPFEQSGETAIDVLFNAWSTNPVGFLPGADALYQLTNYGIQLINVSWPQPAFLYYRKQRPNYTGNTYGSTTNYAVGDQVYFAASTGVGDYYVCASAAAAGQSPEASPTLWTVLDIPYVFFEYAKYSSFADWLMMDGQADKAGAMVAYAQSCLIDEADRQERQSGFVMPIKISTHLTSQNRGIGAVGLSNQPGFLNGQGYGY